MQRSWEGRSPKIHFIIDIFCRMGGLVRRSSTLLSKPPLISMFTACRNFAEVAALFAPFVDALFIPNKLYRGDFR